MKHYTPEQQEEALDRMKKLIRVIWRARLIYGDDPANKQEIDDEITALYKKLDREHVERFEDFLQ